MKKVYLAILFTLFASTASADYSEAYYSLMNGKKREELKAAAKECVSTHQTLEYYSLPNYWVYSDIYPDLYNGKKRWWEMYSDAVYLIGSGQSGTSSFSANHMQREHAVPKSWWKYNGSVEYTPAYSDMWNLYPSDASANQAKLNYPFGETASTIFDNGCTKVGPAKTGYGGGASNVFEPADEYKGDFARACFYMATVYDDLNWCYTYMFTKSTYPTLVTWASDMLLQWARQDPVSQKEIDRNNAVEQCQGNRNPFIDFPELAEYIWGTRTKETFYVKDQDTTDPTPPITGDPELTAPVSGETLDFGEIAVNVPVTRALQIKGKNLTESLSLRVVGADKDCFKADVSTIPASTMNREGGYLLNITFKPTEVRSYDAKITLYDGGLSGSVVVSLHGESLAQPSFSALRALSAEEVTDNGYTARWEAANGVADYYILTRVKYTDNGEEVETYETGETSYQITDRNVNVAESYTVQYSRLGLTSPVSNTIYVAAGTGAINTLETAPFHAYTVSGGFMIRCNAGEGGYFSLYNQSGICLLNAEAEDGAFYALPAGVYVIAPDSRRPQKLIIRN